MSNRPEHVDVRPPSAAAVAQLVHLAEDAIISVDAHHRIVIFNLGAERVFGYRAEEILGHRLESLLPARFAQCHEEHMRDFAACPGGARRMGERRVVRGLRKDGTEFPAEITISKFIEDGQFYFNAIVRDVSERVCAEEEILSLNRELEARVQARTAELEEVNRQLARKNEENETFVYTVSHDLRSPLVNLEGFSRELAHSYEELQAILQDAAIPIGVREKVERILGESTTESLSFIHAAVSRLSGIINALLRLSRAGRVQYEPRLTPLGPTVARVILSLRNTAHHKGATITVGELPTAWTDPVACEQVFANLIGNALNYLDLARPGRITVESCAAEPGEIGIRIQDNGVGIPASHQPELFRAFHRLHEHLAPGEGMGLLIVRRILDRLRGRIWFHSEEGIGTTFYLTLPAGDRENLTWPESS
ncbi:MAG: PAS domain S-box protein [Bacteroidales bacterium]|nr:PAS domain S-box protein [Bacteroidales bacterium]